MRNSTIPPFGTKRTSFLTNRLRIELKRSEVVPRCAATSANAVCAVTRRGRSARHRHPESEPHGRQFRVAADEVRRLAARGRAKRIFKHLGHNISLLRDRPPVNI